MNKKNLAVVLTTLGVAAKAFALTTSVDSGIVPGTFVLATPAGGSPSSGGPLTLTVPKFNLVGFPLTSVSYTLDVWSYATYSVQNFNAALTDHVVSWRVKDATLLLPNASLVTSITTPPFTSELGYLSWNQVASGSTTAGVYTRPSAPTGPTATFAGPGTVNFVFTPSATSYVDGSPGNASPLVFVAARVNVVYTYGPEPSEASGVPEPSTYAAGLVVLAGAGLVLRRRMQAAK
jgi:hypothetical protein